jgi:hypothetical protein
MLWRRRKACTSFPLVSSSLTLPSLYPLLLGLVFSCFMVCKMAGAQLFAALADAVSPTACLGLVFGGSALCMAVPIFSNSYEVRAGGGAA